jgi:hypothetical protein
MAKDQLLSTTGFVSATDVDSPAKRASEAVPEQAQAEEADCPPGGVKNILLKK